MSFYNTLSSSTLSPTFCYDGLTVYKKRQGVQDITTNNLVDLMKEKILERIIEYIHGERTLHYQFHFLFYADPVDPSRSKRYFYLQLPKICKPILSMESFREEYNETKHNYIKMKTQDKNYKLETPEKVRLFIFGVPKILEKIYPTFASILANDRNRAQFNRACWSAISNFCKNVPEQDFQHEIFDSDDDGDIFDVCKRKKIAIITLSEQEEEEQISSSTLNNTTISTQNGSSGETSHVSEGVVPRTTCTKNNNLFVE